MIEERVLKEVVIGNQVHLPIPVHEVGSNLLPWATWVCWLDEGSGSCFGLGLIHVGDWFM